MPERKSVRGFSLTELLLVVAIVLVVTAMAAPMISNSIADFRLRSAAAGVVGLLQNTRMQAVKDDKFYTAYNAVGGGMGYTFIDLDRDAAYDVKEPLVQLPQNTEFTSSGFPSNASMSWSVDPQPPTQVPSFNARGLPCVASGTVCNTTVGGNPVIFVYYLRDRRALSHAGWMAISVNPTGRIRSWSWTGAAWK